MKVPWSKEREKRKEVSERVKPLIEGMRAMTEFNQRLEELVAEFIDEVDRSEMIAALRRVADALEEDDDRPVGGK